MLNLAGFRYFRWFHRGRLPFQAVGSALWLVSFFFAANPNPVFAAEEGAEERIAECEIFPVTDPELAAALWSAGFANPLSDESELSLMLIGSEEGEAGFVLRNGTQAFRLPDSSLGQWQAWSHGQTGRKPGRDREAAFAPQPMPTLWRHLRNDPDPWWEGFLWPTGLTLEMQSSLDGLPKTGPTAERRLGLIWSQSAFTFGFFELGVQRSQFGGGVTRYLRSGDIDFITGREKSPPFWDEADWWWHVSAGVPGLRYEIRSHGGIVPAFLFMERSAATDAKRATSGDWINWFDDEKDHQGNVSHALRMRYGYFRSDFIWDADAYQYPIFHFGLEGIPFGFGSVGLGMWSMADVFFTQMGLELGPRPIQLALPPQWPTLMAITPLRVEFLFRDQKQFHFSLTTRFHFDNRVFRLPGGRP